MTDEETVDVPGNRCLGCGHWFNNLTRLTKIDDGDDHLRHCVVCAYCGQISVMEPGPLGQYTFREPSLAELVDINRKVGSLLRRYTAYRAEHPLDPNG